MYRLSSMPAATVCASTGPLGHGDQDDRSVPNPVESLIDYRIEAAACGAMHSLVLTRSKEVFTWGFNDGPVLGIGDNDIGFPKCLPVRLRRLDRCGVMVYDLVALGAFVDRFDTVCLF